MVAFNTWTKLKGPQDDFWNCKHGPEHLTQSKIYVICYINALSRFSPGLKVISYVGDKETRAELVNTIKKSKQGQTYCFDVLITTYEVKILLTVENPTTLI